MSIFRKRWPDMTDDERASHDRRMAGFHAISDEAARTLQMRAPKPKRTYTLPAQNWPTWMREDWLRGFKAKKDGKPLPDEPWAIDGYLSAAGHAVGELELPPDVAEMIDQP